MVVVRRDINRLARHSNCLNQVLYPPCMQPSLHVHNMQLTRPRRYAEPLMDPHNNASEKKDNRYEFSHPDIQTSWNRLKGPIGVLEHDAQETVALFSGCRVENAILSTMPYLLRSHLKYDLHTASRKVMHSNL